ncbi:MAG: glutamate 5-kinase [Bacteroidota bacterium]
MKQAWKKVVVKVGTNVLTRENGSLDMTAISQLVDQLAELKQMGLQVVLVSSGAVGAGRELLPEADALDPVVRRQMLSSIGQIRLMEVYRQLFRGHNLLCGQVLATKEDFRDRTHYLNMRNCLAALLHDSIIPIVNENDVISVTELMFTDNDELASLITSMLSADALIILSNVDGLLTGPPDQPGAVRIPEVDAHDESVLTYIAPGKSSFGRGGMATKLRMAQRTARLGANVVLANGRRVGILPAICQGEQVGTRIPGQQKVSSVKKWLAHQSGAAARLVINAGAVRALRDSERVSSLLPVGVTAIEGDFAKGDLLRITDEAGQVVGTGLAQYDSETARQLLGQQNTKPIIHYDYLVVH